MNGTPSSGRSRCTCQCRENRSPRDMVRSLLDSRAMQLAGESPNPSPSEPSQSTSTPSGQAAPVGGQETTSSELASRFPTIGSSRAPYIPRRSYTQCVLPHRRLPPPPSSLGKRPRKSMFTRDIVLLDDAESMVIPRGGSKSLKYDLGMIASLVEFDSSWNERRVVEKIEECFKNSLDFRQPPPRFHFLKACGGILKVPNVAQGTEWTGERVKKLSVQSALYIKAMHPVILPSGNMATASTQASSPKQDNLGSDPCCSNTLPAEGCAIPDPSLPRELQITNEQKYTLKEMFPNENYKIDHLLSSGFTFDEIIDELVEVDSESVSEQNLQVLLKSHAKKIINVDDDVVLKIKREEIWDKALVFYKKAGHDNICLQKNLIIEFNNEEGIDAGALRCEFFVELLQILNTNYFEGPRLRQLPICHWGHEEEQEMAGLIVSHSILLGGPGMPCLHPLIYAQVSSCSDINPCNYDDIHIPLNSATVGTIDLIKKLDEAVTDNAICDIVDDAIPIINSCGWPITKLINTKTKAEFIQRLVYHEVVGKRLSAINSFCVGLSKLGLLGLIRSNPDLFKPVFVFNSAPVTTDLILNMMQCEDDEHDQNARALNFFVSYMRDKERGEHGLTNLLRFWTALEGIPPLGFTGGPLTVKFLPPGAEKFSFPASNSCFNVIKLPTVYTDEETFYIKMDQGIDLSLGHFGLH